jgi:hypothetical protein
MTAAAGTVGLGDHGEDLEVGLSEKMSESRDGELGSAAEDEAEGLRWDGGRRIHLLRSFARLQRTQDDKYIGSVEAVPTSTC